MADEVIKACIDRILPDYHLTSAAQNAVKENPANAKEEVDSNLFQKYSQDQTQFTTWDPTSIMEYPIPIQFTTNGLEVGWNRVPSTTDITFIGALYPFASKAA